MRSEGAAKEPWKSFYEAKGTLDLFSIHTVLPFPPPRPRPHATWSNSTEMGLNRKSSLGHGKGVTCPKGGGGGEPCYTESQLCSLMFPLWISALILACFSFSIPGPLHATRGRGGRRQLPLKYALSGYFPRFYRVPPNAPPSLAHRRVTTQTSPEFPLFRFVLTLRGSKMLRWTRHTMSLTVMSMGRPSGMEHVTLAEATRGERVSATQYHIRFELSTLLVTRGPVTNIFHFSLRVRDIIHAFSKLLWIPTAITRSCKKRLFPLFSFAISPKQLQE